VWHTSWLWVRYCFPCSEIGMEFFCLSKHKLNSRQILQRNNFLWLTMVVWCVIQAASNPETIYYSPAHLLSWAGNTSFLIGLLELPLWDRLHILTTLTISKGLLGNPSPWRSSCYYARQFGPTWMISSSKVWSQVYIGLEQFSRQN
jgi:hypothetical protein